MSKVNFVFDLQNKSTERTVSEDEFERAEQLYKKLICRLTHHITTRIRNEKSHDHWCLKWVRKNIPNMAAIMILSKHIKRDIQCLEQQSTLLDTQLENFELVGSSNTKEGAYLYFDCNEGKWIRSGKCTAGGFAIRHRQHLKSSSCRRSTLQFYNLYPSRDKENQSSFRRGYFENLAQYVAIGFDSTKKESMDIMVRDIDDGGIFLFTKEEYQKIEKLNLRGRRDL